MTCRGRVCGKCLPCADTGQALRDAGTLGYSPDNDDTLRALRPAAVDTAPEACRKRRGQGPTARPEGTLEVLPEGFGFLRRDECNYLSSPHDVHVSPAQVRLLGPRTGLTMRGKIRPPREGEQALALTQVETVNGQVPTRVAQRLFFEDHTPLRPNHSESLLA